MVRADFVVGTDVVHEGEQALRPQYSRTFLQEAINIREVVGCDTTCHQVKLPIGKGQIFGIGLAETNVMDALFGGELLRYDQHFGREIAGDNVSHMGREGEGCMPGSRSDVKSLPMGLGSGQFDHAGQTGPFGVDGAGGVCGRVLPKLLLYFFFGVIHGAIITAKDII